MLDGYTLVKRAPSVDDYLSLRALVGWRAAARDNTAKALGNSLFAVCIEYRGQTVGCARVIGDGLYFYIQDVIVHPDHQGRKLGKALMDSVMEFIDSLPGEGVFVGLMAAADVERFYESYGFERRADNRPGMYLKRG